MIARLTTTPCLSLLVAAGCTALADVDVTYEACVPVHERRYSEDFDGTYQDVLDRCWKSDDEAHAATIFTDEGDLVIRPVRGQRWQERERGPTLTRPLKGDFLVVTRAEPASTFQADHCLSHDEAAGLVVMGEGMAAWATLLVRPYFEAGVPVEEACKDESSLPPKARVQAKIVGFTHDAEREVADVGEDAEAFIAICRQGDQLAYYTRRDASPEPTARAEWILVFRHDAGREPLHVGLTVSGAPEGAIDPGMEGHFTWALFDDYAGSPVGDGCEGALESIAFPPEDD
jgi:hypothetical protein